VSSSRARRFRASSAYGGSSGGSSRWQHGIFTGFHRVNGFNYWKEDEGRQRFVRLLDSNEEPDRVNWRALVELVAPDGSVVLEEEDTITIHPPESPDAYVIDFDLLLRAKEQDVTFGKFFVGGLAVRMPWDKANPRQTHLNSNGLRGRECEQSRAAWCNVERPFGAETFGFAVFDHPRNPNHPSGGAPMNRVTSIRMFPLSATGR
jgi:hypothetical protein